MHLALAVGTLLFLYLVVTTFVFTTSSKVSKYLDSKPWVGLRKEIFPRFRAGFRYLLDGRSMLQDGYHQYSKINKLFVLPQFISPPFVVLSPSQMGELLSLPDSEIDPHTITAELVSQKYTTGRDFAVGPHIDVIRRQITRKLPLLVPDVHEELVLATRDQWPAREGEWLTVKAFPTCLTIVSRAANRVFSGQELCREPRFLDSSLSYAQSVFIAGSAIRLFPKLLHPVIGPLLTIPLNRHSKACESIAVPIIRERLRQIRGKHYSDTLIAPNDALQWLLEDCVELATEDPTEIDESRLTRRLLLINMVAINTTGMVMTNVLFDLFTSPRKDEYIVGLREEVERCLHESGGELSKQAVDNMHRIDSTIRESMRLWPLGDNSINRLISSPEGVNLKDDIYFPRGTRVTIASHAIHTDGRFYGETASEWDAFRFSRPREANPASIENLGHDRTQPKSNTEQRNQGLTTTGEDFTTFGHGRHACPGRFFAAQEMKLMLAHIIMKYDVRIDGGRPENFSINGSNVPKPSVEIQVRLRADHSP